MQPIAVIDFETTGLSPAMGDRATEVAIVLVQGDKVVGRFQSLMNAGVRVSAFIEAYTGISNAMLAGAPPADEVMAEAARFVGDAPMVAHNASFDRRFWEAELQRVGMAARHPFACTMLVSRRLYPQAPNHKLGSLVDYHRLPRIGQAHRALADAEMAAALMGKIQRDLQSNFGAESAGHDLLMALQKCAKHKLGEMVKSHGSRKSAQALVQAPAEAATTEARAVAGVAA